MTYTRFENIVSSRRMARYLSACGGDTEKAQILYRLNMRLACEMFVVVSGFEIALRNAIHAKLTPSLGADWLGRSVRRRGIFYNLPFKAKRNIITAAKKLKKTGKYDPDQMVASMEFGTWKYMFSKDQYVATGQCLLQIFPRKPKSTPKQQYERRFFFNELDHVNSLRNRIAHHEPICFSHKNQDIDLLYANTEYERLMKLFKWMGISGKALLKNADKVPNTIAQIEKFSNQI